MPARSLDDAPYPTTTTLVLRAYDNADEASEVDCACVPMTHETIERYRAAIARLNALAQDLPDAYEVRQFDGTVAFCPGPERLELVPTEPTALRHLEEALGQLASGDRALTLPVVSVPELSVRRLAESGVPTNTRYSSILYRPGGVGFWGALKNSRIEFQTAELSLGQLAAIAFVVAPTATIARAEFRTAVAAGDDAVRWLLRFARPALLSWLTPAELEPLCTHDDPEMRAMGVLLAGQVGPAAPSPAAPPASPQTPSPAARAPGAAPPRRR